MILNALSMVTALLVLNPLASRIPIAMVGVPVKATFLEASVPSVIVVGIFVGHLFATKTTLVHMGINVHQCFMVVAEPMPIARGWLHPHQMEYAMKEVVGSLLVSLKKS